MQNTDLILYRIKLAINAKSDREIATALDIKPQSVSSARKKNEIPPAWVIVISETYRVSLDWLWFGKGGKDLVSPNPLDSKKTALVYDRIKLALNAKNETEVAAGLRIKQQSVFSAFKRNKIPPSWIFKIAEKKHCSADWLLYGIGGPNLKELEKMVFENKKFEELAETEICYNHGTSGPILSEDILELTGELLFGLLEEIINQYEKDLIKLDIIVPPELKAIGITNIFEFSIKEGKFNSTVYDTVISLHRGMSEYFKEGKTMDFSGIGRGNRKKT
ncbi:MAG: helix-turn-helix domain containing protein [Proteobacteria bacterium]|nr:helix-turn-helix domain containing protein [Pseudomonadota bacterium]MBU4471163.1 helix-turn-helix domain containing protein [Pseudomonadota bacterium]MCG2751836.1 helix-turn-helix domain containing protein [Desulfobacteraceae bacterium]